MIMELIFSNLEGMRRFHDEVCIPKTLSCLVDWKNLSIKVYSTKKLECLKVVSNAIMDDSYYHLVKISVNRI